MATVHNIKASSRKDEGKGASRRLRHSGFAPAIVYGAGAAPQSIQFEHNALWLATQNEWFYSSILHLDVDGTTTKVLLRDMQRHPFKQQIMHLDFQRVDENQPIRLNVPLQFLNLERCPAGKTGGVMVTH
jgi:large subunit ribosomal protein L25